MTTTIAGVKFSDNLGALLDWAGAQEGWRVEPGRRTNTVTVYAADKTAKPITVSEKGAKLNQAHYENIRRDLYRAGLPPLPADGGGAPVTVTGTGGIEAVIADSPEAAMAAGGEGHYVGSVSPAAMLANSSTIRAGIEAGEVHANHLPDDDTVMAMLNDPESRASMLATVVSGLAAASDFGAAESDLFAAITYTIAIWFTKNGGAAIEQAAAEIRAEVAASFQADVDAALALAADHEATATRAMAALERAEKEAQKARTDCAAALRRAEAAEVDAREAEAALAPLRAFLGKKGGE